jgi:hypothetical protein
MSKKPTTEKPKTLAIIEVRRTRRFIAIHYRKGDEDFKVRSNENPLPAFVQALDALVPIVLAVGELHETWAHNFRIHGFTIGDMRDVKTVSIRGKKGVEMSGEMLDLTTPAALLAVPNTEGATTQPLTAAHVGLVESAIEEAKRYVLGERAQGTLDLDDEAEADADGEEAGDRLIDVPPAPKPKRGRKPKVAAE